MAPPPAPPPPFSSPPPSPMSPSALLDPHQHRLPEAVEDLLHSICRAQSLPLPDLSARRELARLGEDAALHILRQISGSGIRNFSALIMFMARSSDIAMARNAQSLATCESACVSGPSSPAVSSKRGESSLSPMDHEMVLRAFPELASPVRAIGMSPVEEAAGTPYTSMEVSPVGVAAVATNPVRAAASPAATMAVSPVDGRAAAAPTTPVRAAASPVTTMVVSPVGVRAVATTPIRTTTPITMAVSPIVRGAIAGTPIRTLMSPVIDMALPEPNSPGRENQNPLQARATPQMLALGELEFWKAFMILSYLGGQKLEDMVSVEFIKSLKHYLMADFEPVVWRKVGSKCVSTSERRMNLLWDDKKTYVYHCCIDTKRQVTFKGPYLQNTTTHLQNVLGDDNVLVVKFAEMSSENKSPHILDTYSDLYQQVVEEGIILGLRRYQFFVFKDGGKEAKKKDLTSSGVKCYFVRTESEWAMDYGTYYILSDKLIHEARNIFMHAHTTTTLAKYMARFALILSKTKKLDVDMSTVSVKEIEDIRCMDDNGDIARGDDGDPLIHTDGTGLISLDLAMKCPGNVFKGQCLKSQDILSICDGCEVTERPTSLKKHRSAIDEAPLLMQFRLFNNGSAIKGTLLVDKRLPVRTICVRPSMIKVKSDPSISYIRPLNSLEIVTTSNRPKRTNLSRFLIALLHYGGVPDEYFMELLMTAIDEAQNARHSLRNAVKVALNYADMDYSLATRMILCGIPLDEPYLRSRLSVMIKEENKGLMGGKIPISECYYLMGTADPTGTLKRNEVCVILENGQVSGSVLVYKHPGLHFGDIHILMATYVKDLEHIVGNSKFAIFFPVTGPRSLPDEMANSDLDGDMYWVSRNPKLLNHFKASSPWVHTTQAKKPNQSSPLEYSDADLERVLFREFLKVRFTPSYAMSASSDSWLVYMDRLLSPCVSTVEKQTLENKMKRLVDIYYDALDAPKSGLKVEVPSDLRAAKFPHFMEKPGESSYVSTSILGRIYDTVKTSQGEENLSEISLLPCFQEEIPQPCLEKWNDHYQNYLAKMTQICSWEDKEYKESMIQQLFESYKMELYDAPEFEESPRPRRDVFDEALAIYQIAYENAKKSGIGKCGFAWKVAGRALIHLYAIRNNNNYILNAVCSRSVLQEILR